MVKPFIRKVAVAGLVAATMATATLGSAFTVSAGELLGQTNFDDAVGLPWHCPETPPGESDFDLVDGVFQIEIINPGGASRGGEDRWDCQFRHRDIKLTAGNSYTMKFDIWASNAGKFYTKIGSLDGTDEIFNDNWKMQDLGAGQWKTFTFNFTSPKSVKGYEWAFHFGGSGQFTPTDCFPAGTILKFDNMSLINNSSSADDFIHVPPRDLSDVRFNQVGYYPEREKIATVVVDEGQSEPLDFNVLDGTGKTVYSGKTYGYSDDADSGDFIQKLDFSEVKTEGTDYTIEIEGKRSVNTFNIGTWAYDGLLKDSLNYFYQNRSGEEIRSQYITSGDPNSLAREAGHTSDIATPMNWVKHTGGIMTGSSIDTTGGWYDAGDHGKYVVNGGISLWTLQNLYERTALKGQEAKFADGTMSIPENSNDYPDLLDEARVEMEFMLKMQIQGGQYDGLAYHKIHDIKWTALALAPKDDDLERIIKPPTTAATLNLAACAAQSYRLWKGIDDAFANECLEAAEKAYAAAKKFPEQYAPLDESAGGGAYGDDYVIDDFYWAACELYAATEGADYYKDVQSSQYAFKVSQEVSGGESTGTITTATWGNTESLGTFSLLVNPDKISATELKTAQASAVKTGDYYLGLQDEQGYGIPFAQSDMGFAFDFTGYVWGSNSCVINNAIALAYAYDASGDAKYVSGVSTSLDYIFGRNAMDFSYVSGYGDYKLTYPHHRWWSYQVDDSFPMAPSGVLSGGPNSAMQDPYVKAGGYKPGTLAPQKCYLDHIEAWSVNECTINWNAPLAWSIAFMEMDGNATGGEVTPIPTPEPTPEPTPAPTPAPGGPLWGDVDVDNLVTSNDATLLARYLTTNKDGIISADGMINADVKHDNNITMEDLVKLKKYLVDSSIDLSK